MAPLLLVFLLCVTNCIQSSLAGPAPSPKAIPVKAANEVPIVKKPIVAAVPKQDVVNDTPSLKNVTAEATPTKNETAPIVAADDTVADAPAHNKTELFTHTDPPTNPKDDVKPDVPVEPKVATVKPKPKVSTTKPKAPSVQPKAPTVKPEDHPLPEDKPAVQPVVPAEDHNNEAPEQKDSEESAKEIAKELVWELTSDSNSTNSGGDSYSAVTTFLCITLLVATSYIAYFYRRKINAIVMRRSASDVRYQPLRNMQSKAVS